MKWKWKWKFWVKNPKEYRRESEYSIRVESAPGLEHLVRVVLVEKKFNSEYSVYDEPRFTDLYWGYRLKEGTVGNTDLFDVMIKNKVIVDDFGYWRLGKAANIKSIGPKLFAVFQKYTYGAYSGVGYWCDDYSVPLDVVAPKAEVLNSKMKYMEREVRGEVLDKHP